MQSESTVILLTPITGQSLTCRAGEFCFAESLAPDAAVFWSPTKCARVLPVIAAEPSATSGKATFDFTRLRCRKVVLETAGAEIHVLLWKDQGSLQLRVSGTDLQSPAKLFVEALWPRNLIAHRLRAIEALNALCTDERFPTQLFPPDGRGGRLRFVLRALDGSIAGASHRKIAESLMDEERVNADWTDPGENLRDRIRRAVQRGQMLMKGGYRSFVM